MVHPQRRSERQDGLGLPLAGEVGGERDDVAATVSSREIRPFADPDVELK